MSDYASIIESDECPTPIDWLTYRRCIAARVRALESEIERCHQTIDDLSRQLSYERAAVSEDDEYSSKQYHAIYNTLWKAVASDGVNDCATIVVTRIRALEAELAAHKEAVLVLGKEVHEWARVWQDGPIPPDQVVNWLHPDTLTNPIARAAIERSKP